MPNTSWDRQITGMLAVNKVCGHGNQRLASHLVGQIARKQGRKNAAEQHGGHHLGKLGGIKTGRLFNVGKRGSNHANVHTVEQAAQTGHDEEIAHISPGRIRNGGFHVFLVCHGRCILVNWLFSATKKDTSRAKTNFLPGNAFKW